MIKALFKENFYEHQCSIKVINFFVAHYDPPFCFILYTAPLGKPQREQVQAVFLLSIEKAPALESKSLQVLHRPISIVLVTGSINPKLIARAYSMPGKCLVTCSADVPLKPLLVNGVYLFQKHNRRLLKTIFSFHSVVGR